MIAQEIPGKENTDVFFTPRCVFDKAQPLTLPVTLVLNTVGLDMMNLRDPSKEKTRSSGYEVTLKEYKPEIIRKLLIQDCLIRIDLAVDDVRVDRRQVMDFSKLLIFSLLYKQFRREVFEMTIRSPLVKQWNRQNPRKQIDSYSDRYLMKMESSLSSRELEINFFRQNMLNRLWTGYNDLFQGDEDHQKRLGMAGHLLSNIHPFTQTVLLDYPDMEDVKILKGNLLNRMALYLKRYSLPEFNALVLMEYLQCSERENLIAQYERLLASCGREAGTYPLNEMIRGELIKRKITPRTRFSFLLENRSSQSKGAISRLRTMVFSGEKEVRGVNDILFNRKSALRLKKSIKDYLMIQEGVTGDSVNPEILHYYMNSLETECRDTGCSFSSFVNFDPDQVLSITHLIFDC